MIGSSTTKIKRVTAMCLLTITIVIATGCQNNTKWQTVKKDFGSLHEDLWTDTKELVKQKENLIILLGAGGASAYVRDQHDDQIDDHFQGHHTFPRDMTIAVGAIPATELALTGVGYGLSLFTEDEEDHSLWKTMVEAQVLNQVYTMSLKLIAQDQCPNGEYYAWPSGHTSTSMTFATVMNEYYGPKVGIPLFLASGMVMYERMETREHWASDIIFGAAIGYTVGKTVAGRNKPQLFGMDVAPYIDPYTGSKGVIFVKRF